MLEGRDIHETRLHKNAENLMSYHIVAANLIDLQQRDEQLVEGGKLQTHHPYDRQEIIDPHEHAYPRFFHARMPLSRGAPKVVGDGGSLLAHVIQRMFCAHSLELRCAVMRRLLLSRAFPLGYEREKSSRVSCQKARS